MSELLCHSNHMKVVNICKYNYQTQLKFVLIYTIHIKKLTELSMKNESIIYFKFIEVKIFEIKYI
ncbi:hypothetical protein C6567_13115 [Staphylococcus aureus]|uniref:Uncharacterized protein n=1 Tax=Staphylococcus aureus TaxID=1280 RepID=A0AB74E4H9_STAAU|nr:hypothetical protein EHS18_13230 [Staphylococcus aureus]AZL92522.1 hypothetical protein C6567_13115 [Staphylococcus aureus]MBD6828767.1 hypothetical protein [Staphylococcus aureus]MBD6828876.1 hypothetical protein [Staphylococcus aureus]MCB4419508.1 hypothetical protein [Staphylococcus aureus]